MPQPVLDRERQLVIPCHWVEWIVGLRFIGPVMPFLDITVFDSRNKVQSAFLLFVNGDSHGIYERYGFSSWMIG